MMVMFTIVAILIATMSLCVFALREGARQSRVNRQVAVAMAIDDPAEAPRPSVQPIHLARRRSGILDALLRVLLNYTYDAPYHWPLSTMAALGLGVATATVLLGSLMYPLWIMGPTAVLDGCLAVRLLSGWQRRRYANQMLRQLPDAIEIMISAVRAGLPVSEAFNIIVNEMPAPSKGEFRLVTSELELGRTADEAIRMISDRTGIAEYAILAVTLAVQSKSGGRLAQTLQVLADTMRQRIALAGRAKALAGEATLSARVLASLPVLAGGVMYFERPDSMVLLFNDPRGQILFGIGVVSLCLGILTMRTMIRKGTTV
jgi:tight adherence protein B